MKWFVCLLFIAATSAALGSTPPQARPPTGVDRDGAPKTPTVESPVRMGRPPAPEVWEIKVWSSYRRSPQFEWGEWKIEKTFKGDFDTCMKAANEEADKINAKGKNYQSKITKKRIR